MEYDTLSIVVYVVYVKGCLVLLLWTWATVQGARSRTARGWAGFREWGTPALISSPLVAFAIFVILLMYRLVGLP